MTVKTIEQLKIDVNSAIPDNNNEEVDPADVRSSILDTIDSLNFLLPANAVIVKSASQLAGTLDSSVVYVIDGEIDMGSQSIEVPENGLTITGLEAGTNVSILTSSEDGYDMFVNPPGGYAGTIVLNSCTLNVTGNLSGIFNLDNQQNSGSLEMTNVNFGLGGNNASSLGNLDNFRQLFATNIAFFCNDGFTLNGTWAGGFRLSEAIALGFPAATLVSAGAGFTIDNFLSDINFKSVDANSVFCDFAPANVNSDASFSLNNFRTTANNPIPNMPRENLKARFRDCLGIQNTHIGGKWRIVTEQATVINTVDTDVKIAGVTEYDDLQHFSSGAGENTMTYLSTETREFKVRAEATIDGGPNDQIRLKMRHWDDSAGQYFDIDERTRVIANLIGGLDVAYFNFEDRVVLDENDRVELWGANLSDTSNFTALSDKTLTAEER